MPKGRVTGLQPAHRRVLNLALERPAGVVNYFAYVAERCHWSPRTVESLLRQAREYFNVSSNEELLRLWRDTR